MSETELSRSPEMKMITIKNENPDIARIGYDENVFDDDYWLYDDGVHQARIDKSAVQLICYFTDIFKMTGTDEYTIGDIGAGAGSMVKQFHDVGLSAGGCEFSESGRRIAKEKFDINLGDCDLRTRLEYPDNHFDWTYCVGVLSMIPDDFMENAIKELLRVTKYGVLINVGSIIGNNKVDRRGNPHHLTPVNRADMWKLVHNAGGYDWTSIQPPQKCRYGIGMNDEFAGLISKAPWSF